MTLTLAMTVCMYSQIRRGADLEALLDSLATRFGVGQPRQVAEVLPDDAECNRMEEDLRQAKEQLEKHVVSLQSANRELEESQHAAESATRAKSEFLANMSHEIRTPLTAIIGYADIVIEENYGRATQERAIVIKRNALHLLGLINDILDLSKVEAGKMEFDEARCSPWDLVRDVVSLMRVRADAKHLEILTGTTGPLPETILTAPLRLRQILVNLVGNAIKFTERGEVRITMQLLANQERPRLCFEVADTGIGMSEEQVAGLFEPFSQGDGSSTRRFGGGGLGLAVSKRLVEALGGQIEVQSSLGQGSAFRLIIDPGPLNGVRLIHPHERQPDGPSPAPSPVKTELHSRVLLVEDGLDNQRLIRLLLTKAGAHVEAVANGQLAVERFDQSLHTGETFDVILMDMQMPVMDGYSATRELRARGYTGPILALTAHAMSDDRQKCLDAGCDDYMTKPVDRKNLIAAIARWADAARSPSSSTLPS
jgi:signal transduction histidine kinase/ActR/RegA family two-component response regulator